MPRLDIERQKELEPKRMLYALEQLASAGIEPLIVNGKAIEFEFKNESIMFYPYSGWHSGKTIKDGRGLENLLKQLRK